MAQLTEHEDSPSPSIPPKPVVKYYWRNDRDGNPSLQIRIPVPDKETLDKVFAAMKALREIGIKFDTGMGMTTKNSLYDWEFDWEFDWSLTGEHFVKDIMTGQYKQIERGAPK